MERIQVPANIVIPPMNPPIVQALNVSGTVIRLNLPIDQNPESFGNDKPTPPAQIASPASIGDTVPAAILDDIIDAVVIKATAVEPCAHRISCDKTKHKSRIGILNKNSHHFYNIYHSYR